MNNVPSTATEATSKPPLHNIPDFTWEVDEGFCVFLPSDLFINLKGRKDRCLQPLWYKKAAIVCVFFDANIVSQVVRLVC